RFSEPRRVARMTKKLLIVIGIVLAVVAVPVARSVIGGGNVKEAELEPVTRRVIQSSVLASGRPPREHEVKLMTEEIGRVTHLFVEEGDRVTAGQLLLQIDDEAHRAAVEQNAAQVRLQEIAIERQRLDRKSTRL